MVRAVLPAHRLPVGGSALWLGRTAGGAMLGEAHHVTGLDAESDALAHLIDRALSRANVRPSEIGHINAHGTGTQQNDLVEARGIHKAFGTSASDVLVSGTKSMLGH